MDIVGGGWGQLDLRGECCFLGEGVFAGYMFFWVTRTGSACFPAAPSWALTQRCPYVSARGLSLLWTSGLSH